MAPKLLTDGHDFFDAAVLFLDEQWRAVVASKALWLRRDRREEDVGNASTGKQYFQIYHIIRQVQSNSFNVCCLGGQPGSLNRVLQVLKRKRFSRIDWGKEACILLPEKTLEADYMKPSKLRNPAGSGFDISLWPEGRHQIYTSDWAYRDGCASFQTSPAIQQHCKVKGISLCSLPNNNRDKNMTLCGGFCVSLIYDV